MATVEQVERAVATLLSRLGQLHPDVRSRYAAQRTVSCRVSDLGLVYVGRITDEGAVVLEQDGSQATGAEQVRLAVDSDDLVAMTDGHLGVPTALATGRLKVEASVLDLLRLRSLL